MKKSPFVLLLFLLCSMLVWGGQYRQDVTPTKNLIVMVPDGTSIGVVSSARWYQIYNKLGGDRLAIDPYLCGTVKTFCSNAPIGDSAPTTSCYMTGVPQQAGNVAIYPVCDDGKDLCDLDHDRAYQPLATILEAMQYEQGKAVGLVVTCEFPHATPADCSAHYYNRSKYEYIAPQMAYKNLDVMFGGGVSIVTDDMKKYFSGTGTKLVLDDAKEFRSFDGEGRMWALFESKSVPYDLDRDDAKVPSLAEMTEKALERLSRNEKGFFLMVEGSKIDFAAHDNDAVACITDYLAFDRAVAKVMEFALKDGNTTVVIMPDHGNSGFTLGNHRSSSGYARKSLDELFKDVSGYKMTSKGLERLLTKCEPDQVPSVVKKHTNIDLKDDELTALLEADNYKQGDYSDKKNGKRLSQHLVNIMNSRTYFGFTTGGHTGEDVFLAAYHPKGQVPTGMNTNMEMNQYLFDAAGLKTPLDVLSDTIYAKHTEVFKDCDCTIEANKGMAVLTVKKGNKTLTIPAFKSIAELDGKQISLKSVVVYIDKNETFYLPKNLREQL